MLTVASSIKASSSLGALMMTKRVYMRTPTKMRARMWKVAETPKMRARLDSASCSGVNSGNVAGEDMPGWSERLSFGSVKRRITSITGRLPKQELCRVVEGTRFSLPMRPWDPRAWVASEEGDRNGTEDPHTGAAAVSIGEDEW